MDANKFPFPQDIIKKAIGDGEIEFYYFSHNNRTGIKTLELKLYYADGQRKIIVLRDYGFQIQTEEVKVNLFYSKEERNKEIARLYNEYHLTQAFLANIFNVKQPSISIIIKNCKAQKE